MQYEEAVNLWASRHLVGRGVVQSVRFELDPGYSCCGGRDPECYCSLAEGASLKADVTVLSNGATRQVEICYLDMGEVLKEILSISEAGGN